MRNTLRMNVLAVLLTAHRSIRISNVPLFIR